MRHIILPILFLATALPLGAQWRVALLAGSAASHGESRNDTDPAHPEFHAARPATMALTIGRELGPWRLTLESDQHRAT